MTDPRTSEERLTGADRHPLHTDDELVRRWLRAQPKAKRFGEYLWAKVSRAFCVGSTSAMDICKRHGFDPDLKVRKRDHE
jgi:hypothetical protein